MLFFFGNWYWKIIKMLAKLCVRIVFFGDSLNIPFWCHRKKYCMVVYSKRKYIENIWGGKSIVAQAGDKTKTRQNNSTSRWQNKKIANYSNILRIFFWEAINVLVFFVSPFLEISLLKEFLYQFFVGIIGLFVNMNFLIDGYYYHRSFKYMFF